jgi:hypothetical protein
MNILDELVDVGPIIKRRTTMHIINGGVQFKYKYLTSFDALLTVDRFDFENPPLLIC